MRRIRRPFAVLVVVLVAFAGVAALVGTTAAPDRSTKSVELWCKNGYRGSAGGVYGGVPFSVACAFDRQSVTIEGVSGTDYSVRMGVETLSGGFDCFFSGSADQVRETCVEVKLVVR